MPASEGRDDASEDRGSETIPRQGAEPAADEILRSTARQDRATSLEGEGADRSVDELAEGAERAARQGDYGREGS